MSSVAAGSLPGAGSAGTAGELAALARLLGQREVIELCVETFPGMPYIPATPAFQYGLLREHGDISLPEGISASSDHVTMHLHTGTHIDALCHYSRHGRLFGDVDAMAGQNKWRGHCAHGAADIAPIIRRGVLLDVAAVLGLARVPAGTAIGPELLREAQDRAGVEVGRGDVVLVRTGEIQLWPSQDYYSPERGGVAGIDLAAAEWLSARDVHMVGSDNFCIEHIPKPAAGRKTSAMPVHGHLLADKGVYLLEVMNLEELARREVGEFLFIAIPLKIRGATGSPVRPVALV
ncbi:MAG: cyclase family protein [Burkholderiaceae bacterium]